MNSEKFLLPVY